MCGYALTGSSFLFPCFFIVEQISVPNAQSPFDVTRTDDSDDHPTPRMTPVKCVHGCQECGIQKKLDLSACPISNDQDNEEERVTMLIWKKDGPQGKNNLDTEQFSMYDAVKRLNDELEDCPYHPSCTQSME